MSSSGKKLSTFEFLFSWQNQTFLLTENQRTWFFSLVLKLLLWFSQQLQKCAKIQMYSTLCWSVTSLGLPFLNPYEFTLVKIKLFECSNIYFILIFLNFRRIHKTDKPKNIIVAWDRPSLLQQPQLRWWDLQIHSDHHLQLHVSTRKFWVLEIRNQTRVWIYNSRCLSLNL